jgi:ActR/RegA family two-component response regulator
MNRVGLFGREFLHPKPLAVGIVTARKRVLFVDDEASIRVTLPAVLERNGFEVTAVGNVTEAISAISQTRFDVLLSDLNIGEPGDGFTVVSAMRRIQPDARAFIITGYPDFDSALRSIRNQVDDYFVKPADPLKLVAMLQQKIDEPKQTPYGPLKQISQMLQELSPVIVRQFTDRFRLHPDLRQSKLGEHELREHIEPLLSELIQRVRTGATQLSPEAIIAAEKYGSARYGQGYSVAMLVSECHLIERVVSAALQDNLLRIEMSTLIPDMISIGEALNAYIEEAVRGFGSAALPRTA